MLSVYDALNRVIWATNQFDPANVVTAITTRTVYNQLGQSVETQQYAGQLVQMGNIDAWLIDDGNQLRGHHRRHC